MKYNDLNQIHNNIMHFNIYGNLFKMQHFNFYSKLKYMNDWIIHKYNIIIFWLT